MRNALLLILFILPLAGCDKTSSTPVSQSTPTAEQPLAENEPAPEITSSLKLDATPEGKKSSANSPAASQTTEPKETTEPTEKPAQETPSNQKPAKKSPPAKQTVARTNFGSPGVDWPTFLGPTGDSKSTETGIVNPLPAGGLPIVWQKELGTSYGIGTVSKGRFYQFDRHEDNARLSCLDAKTGEEFWTFEYPTNYVDAYQYNGGPRCSPLIDNDRIYLYGAAGILHCLSTDQGKVIWKLDTVKEFGVVQNFFGVGSNPVIEGDLLIVMVGGSPEDQRAFGTGQLDRVVGAGSGIVALNKKTGEVKYKITDELASYASLKLAEIDGRRWCFAFARNGLVGFDPTSGKVDFEYPWRAKIMESVNASVPVVVGDEVFISETYGPGSSLLKVRPGGYDLVWKDDDKKRERAMQTHWNTSIYHDGYVYGCSGRHPNNAELRCIEWKTGKVMWTIPGLTRSSLLYVDGHFVVLSEIGKLFLIEANPDKLVFEGELLKQDEPLPLAPNLNQKILLKDPCWAAPILSHGLLYVRGSDRLLCLELIPPKDKE